MKDSVMSGTAASCCGGDGKAVSDGELLILSTL